MTEFGMYGQLIARSPKKPSVPQNSLEQPTRLAKRIGPQPAFFRANITVNPVERLIGRRQPKLVTRDPGEPQQGRFLRQAIDSLERANLGQRRVDQRAELAAQFFARAMPQILRRAVVLADNSGNVAQRQLVERGVRGLAKAGNSSPRLSHWDQ